MHLGLSDPKPAGTGEVGTTTGVVMGTVTAADGRVPTLGLDGAVSLGGLAAGVGGKGVLAPCISSCWS